MSLLKANAVQLGQSLTASQNFTWYQPASPDGTVRLGNGNAGSVTDLITVGSTGNLTLVGTTTNFSATAARITGYFGPTLASRVVFQSSSANTNTQITTFPSGTATNSGFDCYSTNDGTNASRGLIRIDTAGPDFRINSDITGTGTYLPITFFTSGTERMRLDASGNLGLGVTPSGWSQGKALFLPSAAIGGDATFVDYTQNATLNSGWKYLANGNAVRYEQYNGTHSWYTAGSGTAGNVISFTQAMTLDASGNLLVGDTAFSYGYNGRLFARNDVNTTPVAATINKIASGNVYGIINSFLSNGNNTSSYHFSGVTQGVNQWYLYGNGTSSFTSDERKKKNIETTRNGYLEDLCKLRVVKYNWWTDDDGTPKELGLIAQEVEQIFPGLITNAIHPDVDGETYKVMKGSVIPFMLLKAIQELSAEIETLKQRIK